jgi:hypothetical protein
MILQYQSTLTKKNYEMVFVEIPSLKMPIL